MYGIETLRDYCYRDIVFETTENFLTVKNRDCVETNRDPRDYLKVSTGFKSIVRSWQLYLDLSWSLKISIADCRKSQHFENIDLKAAKPEKQL
jgi:hypothetical protein